MAKSNAQIQEDFRQRKLKAGLKKFDAWISNRPMAVSELKAAIKAINAKHL